MFFRLLAVVAVIVFSCLYCGDKNGPDTPPPAGPTELEGVWTGRSLDIDNPPYPILTYTFVNNTIVVKRDTCPRICDTCTCPVELYRGTFVVDTNISPKTIDIHITQSSVSAWVNDTLYAIYFKSMNNVNISANEPGSARPVSTNPPSVDQPAIYLGQ
jgi:hypothetical protein